MIQLVTVTQIRKRPSLLQSLLLRYFIFLISVVDLESSDEELDGNSDLLQ